MSHRFNIQTCWAFTLVVVCACGDATNPAPYVSYRVHNGSIPGPVLVNDSTVWGAVYVVDELGQPVEKAFVYLRGDLGVVTPADTLVTSGFPNVAAAFSYVWAFSRAQVKIDTLYSLEGCASNAPNRCDDTSYAIVAAYVMADTNPTVQITNTYSQAIVFGWQEIGGGGSADIPGVPRDTIQPGITRCEKLRARPDSAIFFAYNNLNIHISEVFTPTTHPFWVIIARPVGDFYVTYSSDTPGC
jgi:hypothetical protein